MLVNEQYIGQGVSLCTQCSFIWLNGKMHMAATHALEREWIKKAHYDTNITIVLRLHGDLVCGKSGIRFV